MDVDELIDAVGKTKGMFTNKANRAAKLIQLWPHLQIKFSGMIRRGGGHTEMSRLAYGALLMMETGIRVGNESSAEGWICENQIVCRKDNKEKKLKVGDVIWRHPKYGEHVQTYGLTTLTNDHVKRRAKSLKINFVGKKLVEQDLIVKHPALLQHYSVIAGKRFDTFLGVSYHELKKFVKKYVGKNYTPKDIRMAKVNMIFIDIFGNSPRKDEFAEATTKSARKKILTQTIEETANQVGHTKAVCKSAYLSAPMIKTILTWETK